MVTSHLDGVAFPGDTRFMKWREAGLPKPRLTRLAKVVTVEALFDPQEIGDCSVR